MLFTFFLRYLAVQHEHHWRTAGVLWALVDSCFCCAPFLQSWTQNRWRLRGNHRDKVWTPSQHRGGLFYYTTNSSWGVTCADTHALGGLILRVGTQLSFRASSYCALRRRVEWRLRMGQTLNVGFGGLERDWVEILLTHHQGKSSWRNNAEE